MNYHNLYIDKSNGKLLVKDNNGFYREVNDESNGIIIDIDSTHLQPLIPQNNHNISSNLPSYNHDITGNLPEFYRKNTNGIPYIFHELPISHNEEINDYSETIKRLTRKILNNTDNLSTIKATHTRQTEITLSGSPPPTVYLLSMLCCGTYEIRHIMLD